MTTRSCGPTPAGSSHPRTPSAAFLEAKGTGLSALAAALHCVSTIEVVASGRAEELDLLRTTSAEVEQPLMDAMGAAMAAAPQLQGAIKAHGPGGGDRPGVEARWRSRASDVTSPR